MVVAAVAANTLEKPVKETTAKRRGEGGKRVERARERT
jgi:hypothetical protein